MAKIARCISEEYLPNCRPDIGVCSLPDGQKFYDQVKKATIKLLFLRRSFLDFFRVHKLWIQKRTVERSVESLAQVATFGLGNPGSNSDKDQYCKVERQKPNG